MLTLERKLSFKIPLDESKYSCRKLRIISARTNVKKATPVAFLNSLKLFSIERRK